MALKSLVKITLMQKTHSAVDIMLLSNRQMVEQTRNYKKNDQLSANIPKILLDLPKNPLMAMNKPNRNSFQYLTPLILSEQRDSLILPMTFFELSY